MFVKLEALDLQPEIQQQLVSLIPGVESVAVTLGELDFCFEKSEEYRESSVEEAENQPSHNLLSQVKSQTNRGVWFCFSLVAAALNTKATYAISPEGMGDSTRLALAILASAVFVFIADFLIAKELTMRLTRRDAMREKRFLQEQLDRENGIIKKCFYEGVASGFRNIQGNYAQTNQTSSALTLGFLSFYFVVEFVSSVMREVMMGDGFSIFSVAAPSLGMLLNMGTGYFNGMTIEYPKERQQISNRYQKRYGILDKEKQLEQKVSLINHVVSLHVTDPNLSAANLEKQKYERKFSDEFKGIRQDYDSRLSNLKQAYREEEKALRKSMRQDPDNRAFLQDELSECKKELIEETLNVLQSYRESLEVLEVEVENCPYQLSMNEISSLTDSLNNKEFQLSKEKTQLSQRQEKEMFTERLKIVCNRFEADFEKAKDNQRESLKALKQAKSDDMTKEEFQVEVNQCERNYLEDCIRQIQRFKAELNALKHEMDEAGYSTELAEIADDEAERQQQLMAEKLEKIRKDEIALQLNDEFERARNQFSHSVTQLQQQWKEASKQITSRKKVMVEDKDHERKILVENNACNQKFQSDVLNAFEEYSVVLNQIRDMMEKAGCTTNTVQQVINTVESDRQYQEERLEQFREEEKFLSRSVA